MECLFNPGACVTSAIDSLVALVPYGTLGMAFAAGMIIGAILGKWGVGAILALVLAVKVGSKSDYPAEVPDEDPPHIKRLKQSQGVRPKPSTKPSSAFQKWIRGE